MLYAVGTGKQVTILALVRRMVTIHAPDGPTHWVRRMITKRGAWWRWCNQVRIGVAVFQGAQANRVVKTPITPVLCS